jgi:hypothetical protein
MAISVNMPVLNTSTTARPIDEGKACIRTCLLFRVLAVLFAGFQTFVSRNSIGPDGRSYLDLARAYLRHDWAMTINGYWGPFYAWILALVLGIFKPSIRWEYPLVHITNLVIFLVAIAAFEFFWAAMLSYRNSLKLASHATNWLSDFQLWTLGYPLFIWLTVNNLLYLINPDLCLTIAILIIAALATQIKLGINKTSSFALLGIALGLAYLIKAVMFPLGFIFLVVIFVFSKSKAYRTKVMVCAAVFLIVSAPQILLLSVSRKHLTFSDTGKLAFLWYNYDLPLRDWQGIEPNSGKPLHTTRMLWGHPDVFEFNGPIRASYPPWYDPGYWNAGMSSPLQMKVVIKHTVPRIIRILAAFAEPKAWMVGMLLLLIGSNLKSTLTSLFRYWHLILPSMAIMAMYSLTWVEYRYLAVWLVLLWGSLLCSIVKPAKFARAKNFYDGLVILVAMTLLSAGAYGSYGQLVHGRPDDALPEYATAEGLLTLGFQPGDKMAAIGFDNDVHWAHLAKLAVVAEINANGTCLFWSSPPPVQKQILDKLEAVGAKAVVASLGSGLNTNNQIKADLRRCALPTTGWQKIPGSPNEVFLLR